jgi:hypothetical protein
MTSQSGECPDTGLICLETARNRFESAGMTLPTVPICRCQVDRIDRIVQNIADLARSTWQRSCTGSARHRSTPEMYGSGSGGFRYLPARRPTLAMCQVEGGHTGENIASIVHNIITDYAITHKLGYFMADNATNNDKALCILEHRI